jgi:hypothetical protein
MRVLPLAVLVLGAAVCAGETKDVARVELTRTVPSSRVSPIVEGLKVVAVLDRTQPTRDLRLNLELSNTGTHAITLVDPAASTLVTLRGPKEWFFTEREQRTETWGKSPELPEITLGPGETKVVEVVPKRFLRAQGKRDVPTVPPSGAYNTDLTLHVLVRGEGGEGFLVFTAKDINVMLKEK